MLFSILVLLFIVLLTIYCYLYVTDRPENFPPGPIRLPFWGSYWFLLKENYQHVHLSLASLSKKYKTDILGFYLGEAPTVATFSHELCKELLTRDEFIGRNDIFTVRKRGLGDLKGIFFLDGPLWREVRRFSLRNLRDFGFGRRAESIENFTADEIKYLLHLLNSDPQPEDLDICREKGVVLVPDFYYGSLLNIVLSMLCSTRFEYLELRNVARNGLKFQRSTDPTGLAINMTPWLRHIAPDFFGYTTTIETNTYLLQFLKKTLDEHIETFSSDHYRDFIDVYIAERLNQGEGTEWDYNQLLLLVLDYMFPAAIAIGHTLQFYFALLINYAEVQQKVQSEIDKVIGESRLPNLDDRKNMPYLEASIREVLRFIPLNPLGIPRRCMQDTTLGGYFIPKDTIMLPCISSAHFDERVWENPSKFSPERFLDESGNLLKKDNTIGFGAGRRLCAGETFARNTMFLMIASFFQNFTFKAPNNQPIVFNLIPGANVSLGDLWVKALPRKKH